MSEWVKNNNQHKLLINNKKKNNWNALNRNSRKSKMKHYYKILLIEYRKINKYHIRSTRQIKT